MRAGATDVAVTCVGDGAQALAVLDREPIDLLITDLEMPVTDGIELLLQVARRRLLVPLLVVTGHGSSATETLALSSGAIACFEKPIVAAPFLRCVEGLLRDGPRRAPLEVVSLPGVMRLIDSERKTCTLRVTAAGTEGVLMFTSGELVDARQGELSGEPAAQAILAWADVTITLDMQARAHTRTIHVGLAEVLRRASQRADGRGGAALQPRPSQPARALAATPPLSAASASHGATTDPPRLSIVMPAPMPAPASTRPPLCAPDAPGPAPAKIVAPSPRRAAPSLGAPPPHGPPPPLPPPPRVSSPARPLLARGSASPGDGATRLADPTATAAHAMTITPEPPTPTAAATDAFAPTGASAPTDATVDGPAGTAESGESGAPAPAEAATRETRQPPDVVDPAIAALTASAAAATRAALATGDYFELVDRARDLLRTAEFDAAELLLRRALELRPGDRVARQNLQVLAKRRTAHRELNH